jgi:hypothetical protein
MHVARLGKLKPASPSPWDRSLGLRFALAALLAALGLIAQVPRAKGAVLPPQGLYEQCAPSSATMDCGMRLRKMAAAGFRYVLNYTAWAGSAAQVRRYADQASAAGIKLIWPLNDVAWRDGTNLRQHYPMLGEDCGCTTNDGFKRFALGLVKHHRATWGFYIGDEVSPTPQSVAQVSALAQAVHGIAPGRPSLYVTLPRDDLAAQLQPFVGLADVAGTDFYPVGVGNALGEIHGVAATTRRLTAGRSGYAMVLQAFSWSQYDPRIAPRFPTRGEMRRMRDLALDAGRPRMLLWYSYNDLADFSAPGGRWSDLSAAAFAPHVRVRRLRSRCDARRFKFRIRVTAASAVRSVRVEADGRVIRRTARGGFRVAVRARSLRRGSHSIRIVASDRSGHRAHRSARFRSCRR